MANLLLITALVLWLPLIAAGQTKQRIHRVSLCELLKNPAAHDGQTLQIQGIFVRGGEENSELFCARCLEPYAIYADFDDPFRELTPRTVLRTFEKQRDVMLSVTLVGKFIAKSGGHMNAYKYQFIIVRAVRGVELPYSGRAPGSLSPTELRRLRPYCRN